MAPVGKPGLSLTRFGTSRTASRITSCTTVSTVVAIITGTASGAGVRPTARAWAINALLPPLTAMGASRAWRSSVNRAEKSTVVTSAAKGVRSSTSGSRSKKSGMSPKRWDHSAASCVKSFDLSSRATRGRFALLISNVAGVRPAKATGMGKHSSGKDQILTVRG